MLGKGAAVQRALWILRYRARTKAWPIVLRLSVCAARGHTLGQIEQLYFDGWAFHRPCRRCGVQVGCRYESMRGIYEYESGYRHDGLFGLDALIDEAMEATRHA